MNPVMNTSPWNWPHGREPWGGCVGLFPVRWRPLWTLMVVAPLIWLAMASSRGVAAEGGLLGPTPEIDRMIRRALVYIKANAGKSTGSTGHRFWAQLALSQSGEPA